jgi:hypothetical protein
LRRLGGKLDTGQKCGTGEDQGEVALHGHSVSFSRVVGSTT